MRYVGGKGRIAGRIASVILSRTPDRVAYLEPFVGGASVTEKMAPYFPECQAGDISSDLILMWQALQDGWVPPDAISVSEYYELMASAPSALRGLAGFGGSFGGRWFEGYARGGFRASGEPRNHFGESARSVVRSSALMTNVRFRCCQYWEWEPAPGTVIYCDPPYLNDVKGWGGKRPEFFIFDSDKFWDVAAGWARNGSYVFVSEYSAPGKWEQVAEFSHRLSLLRPEHGREARIERLFSYGAK